MQVQLDHAAERAFDRSGGRGLEPGPDCIVVDRDQLRSIETFASTPLHVFSQARPGATDLQVGFEEEWTGVLGEAASTMTHLA